MILIFGSFLCLTLAWAADNHGAIHKGRNGGNKTNTQQTCPISPSTLAQFANGQMGFLDTLPAYLTEPICTQDSYHVSALALPEINFTDRGPYSFLKTSALELSSSRFEKAPAVEARLLKQLPAALRQSPLSTSDYAIVGQLAIISPRLGRKALGNLIQTELTTQPTPSAEIAARLVRMGAAYDLITEEIALSAQELTETQQTDSLGRFLQNLSLSASLESALVPTFNKAALATGVGTRRVANYLSDVERARLSLALFRGIEGSVRGPADLEPGALSLDEAFSLVSTAFNFSAQDLRTAATLVSRSGTQRALASALANNLDSDVLYWKAGDREILLRAAKNDGEVSLSLQRILLEQLATAWRQATAGQIAQYNRIKREALAPWASAILQLGAESVHPEFVERIIRATLVTDQQIESQLPKLVLDRYHGVLSDGTATSVMGSFVSHFDDQLALQLVYIPALNGWIERQIDQ